MVCSVSTHSRLKAAGVKLQAFFEAEVVSTHSRLKAAGHLVRLSSLWLRVSTHSRLKAAGKLGGSRRIGIDVSTHSRLKAAGPYAQDDVRRKFCFNTQPPEGGWEQIGHQKPVFVMFQHTAA